jgi:S1-C subfamily serine protease
MSGISGVVVTGVDPESLAAESGIQRGDIIISINKKPVGSVKEYYSAMNEAKDKGRATILARRGNTSIFFSVKLK